MQMRKIVPAVLVLALLLSGCGLADQARTVNEKYIAPAEASAANKSDDTQTETVAGPAVATDKSALTDYQPPEDISYRLSDAPLTALSPAGDYGALLPYVGAYYYDNSGNRLDKYGLVTADGMIVLDPVLTSLDLASYSAGGKTTWLAVYIMGEYIVGDDGVGRTMYALAGKDGSWVTGFDYTQVLPMELGVLCVVDGAANAAVCYDETGAVVFDTRNFASLARLAPDSIASLANCSDGHMIIDYTNGQHGFMDKDGGILNRNSAMASYFDDVRPFSEDLAAVELYGKWNYIGKDGNYAIYGLFDEAGDFHNGVAVVKKDGVYTVIDTGNKVLKEFPDAESVTAYGKWIAVKNADGTETDYLTPSMTEANLYDKEIHMCADGYWVVGENGVRMRTFDGNEIYFSGAVALEGCSGGGLYLLKLADNSLAVMDAYSRVVVTGGTAVGFVSDAETGDTYIYRDTGDGAAFYTVSGALTADSAVLRDIAAGYTGTVCGENYGPVGGFTLCADKFTAGLKNAENDWVFRIKIDVGD